MPGPGEGCVVPARQVEASDPTGGFETGAAEKLGQHLADAVILPASIVQRPDHHHVPFPALGLVNRRDQHLVADPAAGVPRRFTAGPYSRRLQAVQGRAAHPVLHAVQQQCDLAVAACDAVDFQEPE